MTYNDLAGEYDREIERVCDPGKVGSSYACPLCGEDDEDKLLRFSDTETVRCTACGCRYDPLC